MPGWRSCNSGQLVVDVAVELGTPSAPAARTAASASAATPAAGAPAARTAASGTPAPGTPAA